MSADTIAVHVNAEPRLLDPRVAIGDLVRQVVGDAAARGVAVARNGEVLPRAAWSDTTLVDGDVIEIVRPVQGG